MLGKNKILPTVGLCLAILPAVLIGIFIIKYSVNFVYWDEWVVGEVLIKAYKGKLSFADMIGQHNESRYFFPRLIFIALAYLTRWDVRYEMLISFLLASVVSLNVYKLNTLTVGDNLVKRIIILILANILIFAPIQYENWLWGIQLIVFMPIFCITSSLVVAYSGLNMPVKFLICLFLSTVSTFSYANGILCWVVIFPVLALSKSWKLSDLIRQKWLTVGWIAGFTTNVVIYFYKYQKHLPNHNYLEAVVNPQKGLSYFLSFLGAPLGWGALIVGDVKTLITFNTILGATFVILFLGAWIYLLKGLDNPDLTYRMAGFLMIGSYTVISALVTTLGRISFGVEQALAARYTTFSLYLPIVLIHLIPIIIDDAVKRNLITISKKIIYIITLAFATFIIFLHLLTSNHAVKYGMRIAKIERLQGKACLLFINVAPNQECLATKVLPYYSLYPYNIGVLKDKANALNGFGLLNPSLVSSKKIKDIAVTGEESSDSYGYGWFDSIVKGKGDEYVASGWARLLDRKEPADAVVLTYEDAKGEDIVFAVSSKRVERPDVAKNTRESAYLMSGWEKIFKSSKVPKGLVKIKAWAFDSNRGKAFPLKVSHTIRNQ